MMSSRIAGGLIAMLAAVGAFVVVAIGTASDVVTGKDGHRRTHGEGQIKFDGLGPERWAARWRRERRAASTLRRLLAARLARVVYLVDAFRCVHVYEGSWSANTGNGYYGGLQMDVSFMRSYGPELLRAKGTADRWTPAEQLAVAITAHATRGFSPWPNTARRCGLR